MQFRLMQFRTPSYPATGSRFGEPWQAPAGYRVCRDAPCRWETLVSTGSSAGACHRAALRADPLADDDV